MLKSQKLMLIILQIKKNCILQLVNKFYIL